MGPSYRVTLVVKPSTAPKSQTIRSNICKVPASDLPASSAAIIQAVLQPATLLDVFSADTCLQIKAAEAAVNTRAKKLAQKTRDMTHVQWQVLRKHKVTLTTAIPDNTKRAVLRRTLVSVARLLSPCWKLEALVYTCHLDSMSSG